MKKTKQQRERQFTSCALSLLSKTPSTKTAKLHLKKNKFMLNKHVLETGASQIPVPPNPVDYFIFSWCVFFFFVVVFTRSSTKKQRERRDAADQTRRSRDESSAV